MSIDPVPYGQAVEDRASALHRWLIETLEALGAGWDLDGICDANRIAAVQTRAMAQALSWGLECDIRSGNFGDETGLTSIRWIEREGALPARLMADWVVLWEEGFPSFSCAESRFENFVKSMGCKRLFENITINQ